MARRRRARTRTRTVTRREAPKRRRRRDEGKAYAMKALKGAVAGVAIAVPMGMLARYSGMPDLFEIGERAGAVAASHFGGTMGQVGFQVMDAVVERAIPRIAGSGSLGRITEAYG